MKKLILDELDVESFVTTPDAGARPGTVLGHSGEPTVVEPQEPGDGDGGFTDNTCFSQATCFTDCGSCQLTCANTCAFTCPATCHFGC